VTWTDAVGVTGVLVILVAYAGATLGKLDVRQAPSLLANFVGASMILWSLTVDFNLSAVLMEGAWALVALIGLIRVLIVRLRPGDPR
jgi:hypothetical protein